jgi:hypothetical protein
MKSGPVDNDSDVVPDIRRDGRGAVRGIVTTAISDPAMNLPSP